MRRFALVLLAVALFSAGTVLSGCKNGGVTPGVLGGGSSGGPASGGGSEDVALKALADAQTAMKVTAGDAVPISVGNGGVVYSPPGDSWQVLFSSPSTKKMYRVNVQDGKAGAPETMGSGGMSAELLSSAVKPSDIKIGAAKAYTIGSDVLKSNGGQVPPAAMMSAFLVDFPGMKGELKGTWSVVFLKGTSMQGSRTVSVDMITGRATEAK